MVKNKKFYYNLDKSKIKLKIIKESTVVDEKNHRVIHIVDWKLDLSTLMNDLFSTITTNYNYIIEGRAKGIAYCQSEDTFDPEKGIKMARTIAESNAYHNASTILKKRISALKGIVLKIQDQIIDFSIRAIDIEIHNKEYQDSLICID